MTGVQTCALPISTAAKRLDAFSQLSTIAESGDAGDQSGNGYGLLLPFKTMADIVMAVRSGALTALNDTPASKRLTGLSDLIFGDSPEEFAAFVKSEIATLGKIIKQTGLTVA